MYPVSKVYAITNQKGGVGKTTTAINLATYLAASGRRVLLVDMDPQGNTTSGIGVSRHLKKAAVYNLVEQEKKEIRTFDVIFQNQRVDLVVAPYSMPLASMAFELLE